MDSKQFNVKITVWFDGEHPTLDVYRNYGGTYDEMHNKDWNETVQSFLDDVKGYQERQ